MGFNGDLYPTAGATSVMTSTGDIVRYDSQRERYGIGATNQVLAVTAGLPAWKTLTTADSVLTTQGDVLYESASGLARLGQSTDGHVLTTKGASANPEWAAVSAGATLTTQSIVPTADQTTTSGSYAYILNTEITLSTETGGKALLFANIKTHTSNQNTNDVELYYESADQESATQNFAAGIPYTYTITGITDLDGGTVSCRWRISANTATLTAPSIFQTLEIS